jgi:hypothetical protein
MTSAGHARRVIDAVDPRDVRMIQRCQDLRFSLESGEAAVVGSDVRRQHLNRDVAA